MIQDWHSPFEIPAMYYPPRHSLLKEDFDHFFLNLGHRFIARGDFNAKRIDWGNRNITWKGRLLYKGILSNKLNYVSTGELTYWPTDTNKLIDFFINKNISPRYIQVNSSLELSSDHSPVIVTVGSTIIENQPAIWIYNKSINWSHFKESFNISKSNH